MSDLADRSPAFAGDEADAGSGAGVHVRLHRAYHGQRAGAQGPRREP